MNGKLAVLWIFILVLLLWQGWSAYHELPDRMPSHFNLQGQPDSFSSKESFLQTWFLALFALNALVPICRLVLGIVPPKMINVPNRSYWLTTPERRRQVAIKMTNLMGFVFTVVDIMFLVIFESIRSFALTGKASIPLWAPMLLLPIVFAFPLVYLFRTFRIPQCSK